MVVEMAFGDDAHILAIRLTGYGDMMNEKGFTITKSLQYTLAMNFAVPCASIFMGKDAPQRNRYRRTYTPHTRC